MNQQKAFALIHDRTLGTDDEYMAAWQFLADTGIAWAMGGEYARIANTLLECERIKPPLRERRERK